MDLNKFFYELDELLAKGKSFVAENKMEELTKVNEELAKVDNEMSTLETFEKAKLSDDKHQSQL